MKTNEEYEKEFENFWKTYRDKETGEHGYPSYDEISLWWRNKMTFEKHDMFYDMKKCLEDHALYNIHKSPFYSEGVRDSLKHIIEIYKQSYE